MKVSEFAVLLPAVFTGTVTAWNDTFLFVDPSKAKCDDPYLNDANSAASDRWRAAGAPGALNAVTWMWNINQSDTVNPTRLKYTEYVSNYFNGGDLMICGNMGDGPCQHTFQCDELNQPAGFLILNSFVGLHIFQRNIYESIQGAMNQMKYSLDKFQDTFSPAVEPEKQGWLLDFMNGITTIVGLGSAFAFNIGLKATAFAANANAYAMAQEGTNLGIGFVLGEVRAHLPAPEDIIKGDLSTVMGGIFEKWLDAQFEFLRRLFSGTLETQSILAGLVSNGLALDITRDLDLGVFVKEAQKLMMIKDDCITSGDDVHWMVDSDDADKISVCHDGHTFFVGYPHFKGYTSKGNPRELRVSALPGGTDDELNSANWGGITLEDMVISVYDGFRLNGFKNGYKATGQGISINGTTADGNTIAELGVRTPGFVPLPLCSVERLWYEAKIRKDKYILFTLREGEVDTFPCGSGELTADEMVEFGWAT
ncbi:hypothetical protein B0T10DRAFT_572957 [Thelonectria olida]|uniref:Uncharacterized protein n=1 Tax=Thelonectria olida TaxID=1576542 RepID=A0A9P8W3T3_9HYPO|nr:hypothetical protein B0T10DRAFT_572957 [Thelonectria olida]